MRYITKSDDNFLRRAKILNRAFAAAYPSEGNELSAGGGVCRMCFIARG